jgi:hypothetical protein
MIGGKSPFLKSILVVVGLLALVGGAFLITGLFTPPYRDADAALQVIFGKECELGVPNPSHNQICDSDTWHRSMERLLTNKWPYIDFGIGLIVFSISLAVFGWFYHRKGCLRWREIQTPKTFTTIILMAALCWLIQIPAYLMSLFVELSRNYYPWWADSFAIPLSEIPSGLIALFVPYLLLWAAIGLVFFYKSRLPTPVFPPMSEAFFRHAVWTTLTTIIAAPVLFDLGSVLVYGPSLMVPFLALTLWLLICARAAALNRHTVAET